jgi:hypothetical protein
MTAIINAVDETRASRDRGIMQPPLLVAEQIIRGRVMSSTLKGFHDSYLWLAEAYSLGKLGFTRNCDAGIN